MFKNELVVKVPHRLTQQEARRRIEAGVESLRQKYADRIGALETNWEGDRLTSTVKVLGASVSSQVDVEPHEVVVAIRLPFVLAVLKDKIQSKIVSHSTKLLRVR